MGDLRIAASLERDAGPREAVSEAESRTVSRSSFFSLQRPSPFGGDGRAVCEFHRRVSPVTLR
jgi:hypothetical protein